MADKLGQARRLFNHQNEVKLTGAAPAPCPLPATSTGVRWGTCQEHPAIFDVEQSHQLLALGRGEAIDILAIKWG